MAKFNFNIKQRYKQYKNTAWVIISALLVLGAIVSLFAEGAASSLPGTQKKEAFSGVLDDTFSESDTQSAMTAQQLEVDSLKKEVAELKGLMAKNQQASQAKAPVRKQSAQEQKLAQDLEKVFAAVKTQKKTLNSSGLTGAMVAPAWPTQKITQLPTITPEPSHRLNKPARIHTVSFNYDTIKPVSVAYKKNVDNYVPSGTFVKAIVLGGVDADASVNGLLKNNGTMLFKLVSEGTLPNNQHSHLKGCFITASTYGDISSERAYVSLYRISCARKGRPLIDKPVDGWAFFNGKVGIKGKPMMRDGKVVTWAGVSGALSGIASAAQYAQSVQAIGPYGASSVVPSNKIGAYAGLGGASKAADQLSSYYIKRAEQYHPVIQVGAGNLVNIVFKEGFNLYPEAKDVIRPAGNKVRVAKNQGEIPEEFLNKIKNDGSYELGSQINTQG